MAMSQFEFNRLNLSKH